MVVAGIALLQGYLLVRAARPALRGPLAWALAAPALMGFVFLLMLGHILTRGAVLSGGVVVPLLSLAAAIFGIVRIYRHRSPQPTRGKKEAWIVAGLLLVAMVIWSAPVFRALPLEFRGDARLHLGWAAQLMNGEATPSAPITGEIPNYYPWLFHSLLAFIAHFTPGGRPMHALSPVHLIGVGGSVLAFYALGRELMGRLSGVMAALFGAMSGGLGYLAARRVDVVLRPRASDGEAAMTYLGDLLHHKSYNFAYNNLSPPFPRDLPVLLLPAFLLLLVLGMKRRHTPTLAASGAILGLIGLTHIDSMIVGILTVVVAAMLSTDVGRARVLVSTLGPAFAVWGVWLAPVVFNYIRLGGFVDLSLEPVVLPFVGVLMGWGLAPFLAVVGVAHLRSMRSDPAVRVIAALLIAAGSVLLAATLLPRLLGEGFTTLGYAHRYWPLMFVGVALMGAVGASRLVERLSARDRRLGILSGTLIGLIVLPSPLIGSIGVARIMEEMNRAVPIDFRTATGEPDALPNLVAPGSGRCTAAVSPKLSTRIFSYSGYRMVVYARNHEAIIGARSTFENVAYVRWANIYEHIVPQSQRLDANHTLIRPPDDVSTWRAEAERFGVDVVVLRAELADHPALEPYEVTISEPHLDERFAVVRLTDCGT
jgi:hypothetical protein